MYQKNYELLITNDELYNLCCKYLLHKLVSDKMWLHEHTLNPYIIRIHCYLLGKLFFNVKYNIFGLG